MSYFKYALSRKQSFYSLLLTLLLFAPCLLLAQTPISPTTWMGSPASAAGPSGFTTLPATVTPGTGTVSVSQWDRGAVVVNAAAACYNSNNWQLGGSLASAQTSNKCVFFTITNSAATELQVTNLLIKSQVSATGPQNVQVVYTIGATTSTFGPAIATAHSASPETWNITGNVCIGPGQTATFRLYGWGATGSAGTLRINDGTAVTAGFTTPVTATASSTSPICVGTDLSLSGVVSGGIPGYSYSWAGPGGFSSTLLSPTITAAPASAAGVYTLTVTDALTCTTSTAPVTTTVTINSAPAAITGTTLVCPTLTTTLSDLTPGGTWSSSDGSKATVVAGTGVVTGVASGTVTITYTLSSLCFATITVTVDTPPGAITGSLGICRGRTTTLSSSTGGGTWTSSDGSVATIGSSSGFLSALSPGTTSITYTIASGCIATAEVTVHALPAAITGATSVCLGTTTTLSNASPGGTWSSSLPATAGIGGMSGIVSGNAVGTATVSYIITATGCSTTRTETVNPLPSAISGPTTVCPGLTITLASSPTGGTWTSQDGTIATAAPGTGVITGVAAGVVNITYTLPTGCIATRATTVNPAPPAIITPIGDTTFCPGYFVVLTTGAAAGLSYQWFLSGSPLTGEISPTYIATTAGNYSVRVTNSLGCPWMSAPMAVTIASVTATITVPGGVLTGCSATPVMLDANTGAGLSYQWMLGGVAIPGATGSSYAAGVAGDYQVIVSNTTGCFDISATVTIAINPSPSVAVAASGPLAFCAGGSVTLFAATGAGYSYQWHNASGPITGATSSAYTAGTTGNYFCVISSSLGCVVNSVVSNVVANPLPNVSIALSGPRVFCAGGSVTLSAITGSGLSWQWYKSGTLITGAVASSYVAAASGGYRVRITNMITGCTDLTHADTVVTALGSAVVMPLTPTKFCWGGSSLLSTNCSSVGSLITYQWFINGLTIPGATAGTYSADASGAYSCKITVPASCTQLTSEISVSEMPLPDPIITRSGSVLRAQNYYIAYQWYKDLVAIPGATSYSMTPTGYGNYKVRVTDTNGCQSVSANYVHNSGGITTGIINTSYDAIRIYPNPANETLYIDGANDLRIVIFSMDGKVLIDKLNSERIDVRDLADGVYILSVIDSDGMMIKTEKLVKYSK